MPIQPLNVLVRTAASPGIGAGHVARTSAVAMALSSWGAKVKWACDASTVPYLLARGVTPADIRLLKHAATEGQSGEAELSPEAQRGDALHALSDDVGFRADVVLLDSYLLGDTWQRFAQSRGAWVAVFDDLLDRPIAAELIVNAASAVSDYEGLASGSTALCGLRYAVASGERAAEPLLDEPGALLVAFGASDPADATSSTLRALEARRRGSPPFQAWVQLGAGAPHRDAVSKLAAKLGWAQMIAPTEAVEARARRITLCIGAAGVSLFERMRDGIPGIVVPLATNQRRIAAAAASCGAAVIAESPDASASIALEMRSSLPRLREMSASGREAIDGLGARRIATTIALCCR